MRKLENKTNVQAPDSDFPFGRVRDKTASIPGTPVDEEQFGDMHQFFEKLMDVSGITPNELPENDYSGFQLIEALLKLINSYGESKIAIGDWNIDATQIVTIPHGLGANWRKIKCVKGYIRNDDDTLNYPLYIRDSMGATDLRISYDATNVYIFSYSGSDFDNSNFDSTSYNRGYIFIELDLL